MVGARPAECLDDAVLLRMAERSAPPDEVAGARDHLDECASCSVALLALVRGVQPPPPRAPSIELPADTRIGRFALEGLIGSGNMGTVFAARDPQLGREVALKLLRAGRSDDRHAAQLLREARAMAQVRHPNVVTVYDVGSDTDLVFVAMERIRGPTLRAAVAERRPPRDELLGWLSQAASGVAAVHAAGLVHRDLKPDNVFLEDAPGGVRVVVGDLGLAVAIDLEAGGRSAGGFVDPSSTRTRSAGTPAYMAPEQLRGDPIDHRADVFALAVTAWELLAGRRPFEGRTIEAFDDAIRRGPPALDAPPALAGVLARCLAHDRDARPPLDELLHALAPAEDVRSDPRRPASDEGVPPRRPWLVAGGALALAGAGVIAVIVRSDGGNDEAPREVACDPAAAPPWDGRRAAWVAQASEMSPFARDAIAGAMDARARAWRGEAPAACAGDAIAQEAWRLCRARVELQEAQLLELAVARRWPDDRAWRDTFARLDPPAYCRSRLAAEDAVAASALSPGARTAVDAGLAMLVRAGALADLDATDDTRAALAEARRLAATVAPSPLDAELAIAAATLEPAAATAAQVATWRAAVADAERSGRASPVAHAWLGLAERAGPLELDAAAVDHALAQADWAIGRVGDPPRLRVRWLATAGSVAWVRGDIASVKRRFVAAAALAGDDPALAPARSRAYAMLATATGDDGKAVQTYRTLLADRDLVARMPVADRIVLHSSLSEALYRLGELAEALRENEAARALARNALPAGDPSRLLDELVHASILVDQGDARGSLATVDGALPRLVASLGARHPLAAAARIRRAQALLALERATEAEAALAEAIAILDDRYAHRSEEAIVARALLADVHARAGRHDRRAAVLDEALRDAAALYGTSHTGWAQIAEAAGEARAAAGRAADAVPLLEAALPILTASGSPDQTARARFALAKLLVDTDTPRSVALARTAEAELAKLPPLAKLHADVVAWLAGR